MSTHEIAKALSSSVRMAIFESLLQRRISNKSALMEEHGLDRAALEYHLRPLIDAGLVGVVDVTIDGVKNSICYPAASVRFETRRELSEEDITRVFGREVRSDMDHEEIRERAQGEVLAGRLTQEDAAAMVRTLFDHRGRGTRNLCASCGRIRRVSEMVLCHRCFGPVCAKCQKTVQKSDGTSEILCSKCVKEMFG